MNDLDIEQPGRRALLPAASTEVFSELLDDLSALIDSDQRPMVLNMVADLYAADIASILSHLALDRARMLFRWLPQDLASDVLPELDDDFRAALLEKLAPIRIGRLLDDMEPDEAADVLADLPTSVAETVLPRLEDESEVRVLLEYPEDSAGGIMGTDFVAVRQDDSVGEATEEVRRNVDTIEPIFAVYVVDDRRKLVGVAPLKKLLLSQTDQPVSDIMETDVISIAPDLDQEEVARAMERYDLVALPVVDEEGTLIGRITIDQVVDVLREEAEEDIQRMSGVTNEELTSSVLKMSRARLLWLVVGLCGAFLSALVIGAFEEQIEKAVVLAMFIPVVMAMAGNAGIQSSAIAVQGLASGDLWISDIARRLGKELTVALINGLVLAFIIILLVMGMSSVGMAETESPQRLALTVALTLLTVIILAASVGASVPLLLDRLGIDPALATGPFITTSNDLLGLIVYFLIASQLYL